MLTGPRRGELLGNRRILVVNGAQGKKKQKIIDAEQKIQSLKKSIFDLS